MNIKDKAFVCTSFIHIIIGLSLVCIAAKNKLKYLKTNHQNDHYTPKYTVALHYFG